MMIITQSSFKEIRLLNFVYELVISKSMHEPPSPLKHVLFHHLVKRMLLKEILHYFILHFYVKITKNDNISIPN